MASACRSFVHRASAPLNSAIRSNLRPAPAGRSAAFTIPSKSNSSPAHSFSVLSLAGAGMRAIALAAPQCGGSVEDDVMPERDVELSGAFTGARSVRSKVTLLADHLHDEQD